MFENNLEDAARVGAATPSGQRTVRVRLELSARLAVLLAVAGLILAPGVGLAEGERGDMAKEAGVGAGSALASLIYGPTKIVYATGGILVGGLAFAFSGGDKEVAKVILTPSVRGDYVITPKQLKGQEDVEFFGRNPEYRSDAEEASAPVESDVASAAPADGW